MNRARRKELARIAAELTTTLTALDAIADALEELREEEQEALDNMPESLQNGERGEAAQEGITTMDEALDLLRDWVGSSIADDLGGL